MHPGKEHTWRWDKNLNSIISISNMPSYFFLLIRLLVPFCFQFYNPFLVFFHYCIASDLCTSYIMMILTLMIVSWVFSFGFCFHKCICPSKFGLYLQWWCLWFIWVWCSIICFCTYCCPPPTNHFFLAHLCSLHFTSHQFLLSPQFIGFIFVCVFRAHHHLRQHHHHHFHQLPD